MRDVLIMYVCEKCGEEHYFEADSLPDGKEHCEFCEFCFGALTTASSGRQGTGAADAERYATTERIWMAETPDWFLVVQSIASVAQAVATMAIVLTFFVYRGQLHAMQSQSLLLEQQMTDLQRSRSRQQLYDVVKYLLSDRLQFEKVISLAGKPLSEWAVDEREAAFVVCSTFHLVGALVQEEVVPDNLFCKLWYYSVPRCHDVLKPYLDELRRVRGPNYWSRFDWLAKKVAECNKDVQGWPVEC